MEAYDVVEFKGFHINIWYDPHPIDPRAEFDNLGTVVCWHTKYDLGDKHSFETPNKFLKIINRSKIVMLPIYMYDHSGITIRTYPFSCPWDSGQVGWIYADRKKCREEFGWKLMTKARIGLIETILKNEVEVLDNYLTGWVFGYTIEPIDESSDLVCQDSCWGFFGDGDIVLAIAEAKLSINCVLEENHEKRAG